MFRLKSTLLHEMCHSAAWFIGECYVFIIDIYICMHTDMGINIYIYIDVRVGIVL